MRRHTYCTRWVRDGRCGSDWTHAHRSDDGEIADYVLNRLTPTALICDV